MATVTPEQFRELLERELPGALAPTPRRPAPQSDDAATARPRARKPDEGPPNLLATDDAVVHPEHVPAVARLLRDSLGYVYLSNITAADYLADGVIELIYHFFQLEGGPPLVVKTRVPRDQPSAPSLTPLWPGAELQEREAFDLYGVEFPGHPHLRRIYMWDEFEGFPMRKDFPRQGDKYFEAADEE